MIRNELLTMLKKIEPALAAKDLVPVLACICFGNGRVFAYDDLIGLSMPIEDAPVKGAIRGRIMLEFLSRTSAKEVEFIADGEDKLIIKAGRSKLTTPLLPESDFEFKEPDLDQKIKLSVSDGFIDALEKCSISLGTDPNHQWRLGVTINPVDGGATFYSTDNRTATRCKTKLDLGEVAVLLPPRFVSLFLGIVKSDPATEIIVADRWVTVVFDSGLQLFSRIGSKPEPKEYETLFANYNVEKAIDLPQGFARCMERAESILAFSRDKYSNFEVKEGKLVIVTESDAGRCRDNVPAEDHPEISVDVPPGLILRALEKAERILITKAMVMLRGKRFDHLVGTIEVA